MSPLKNYTTEISAMKSVGEIQGKLVAHGASSVLVNYGPDREPVSLSFVIRTSGGISLSACRLTWLRSKKYCSICGRRSRRPGIGITSRLWRRLKSRRL